MGDSSADLDYLSVNSLTLNGGQIVGADDTSTASDLTLPAKGSASSLAGTKNIVVKPSGTASSTEASTGSGGSSTSGSTGSTSSGSGASVAKPGAPSFTPASGKAGTKVTLTGSNYKGATAVTFNGTKAKFTVSSATKIVATVPAGAKTGKIAVTTASGTATSAKSFTVR